VPTGTLLRAPKVPSPLPGSSETVDGVEFAVVQVESERLPALEVLPRLIPRLISGLQVPRGMRWGSIPAGADEYLRFSRPILWLLAKLGAQTLSGEFYGLPIGDVTQGHRVLGAPIIIDRADHYERHLAEQKVVASQDERRATIVQGLDAAAAELHGRWSDPGGVLAEAVYLAEWPSVARGGIADSHLRLPDTVLVTAMQSHQRYFPVRDAEDRLLPAFLYVSNADPAAAEGITRGNERVLGGRLDDAEFAYDRDLAEGLEAMAGRLKDVVFHEKLGSLADKSQRLQGLVAGLLAGPGGSGVAGPGGNGSRGAPDEALRTAARLAKADLRTEMVAEFPELQGTMGWHYARHDSEAEDVSTAIREHYLPRFAGDRLPGTVVGTCVALADKLEALAGLFGIDERPTGDKDPYGLRRHALGILRIVIEGHLPLPLPVLLSVAFEPFGTRFGPQPRAQLEQFLYDRLRGLLQERGYSTLEVEAVVSLSPARIDRVAAMLAAVRTFSQLPEALSLAAANKRIGNILKKAPAGRSLGEPGLLREAAEQALAAAFARVSPQAERLLAEADYSGYLAALAPLKEPVDRFFEEVMVMVEDVALRDNRLALLAQLRSLMNRIADLSFLSVS
jgi:glycyl-tRNA synthetase beta chain